MYTTGDASCLYTATQARAKISEVPDAATQGEPIGITRRDGSSAVVINKAEFEAYQNATLENLAVEAATGEKTVNQFRHIYKMTLP